MFNFQQLVESLLLENQQVFLQKYSNKIPGLNAQVLDIIQQLLSPTQSNYVAAKTWAPYTDFTPVLNAITLALASDGTFKTAQNTVEADMNAQRQAGQSYTKDNFYNLVDTSLNSQLANLIKPLDRYGPNDTWSSDVRKTHSSAIKQQSSNVLIQNVWPQLENLTIVDAISTILKNRLNGLEKLQLKFFVPLNKISEIATGGNYDNIMSDIFKNYEAYSKGSKKYSKDIVEILKSIDITPEDFVKVAAHTNNLYKLLLNNKFRTLADDVREKLLTDSLTYNNIWNFAKKGILTHIQTNNATTSRAIYTLKFIETNKTDPGDLLIEQIKSMSTGIRVKDQSFQQLLSKTVGALGALTSGIGPVN